MRLCVSLLAILLATVGPAEASEGNRPFAIDDYLALEATGKGIADARRIVWEQAPAYDTLGYFGHNGIGAWGYTGHALRVLDLSARPLAAAPLFPPESGVSYWTDSLSPDGRYVAFYAAREGRFFMGVFDTADGRLHELAAAPLVHWYMGRESLWVSDEELVFSAYGGEDQPLDAIRPLTGRRLYEAQRKSWTGARSVSVVRSGAQGAAAPGRLYKANARTGALTLLAEGKFESLKISGDGRYLAALQQGDLPATARTSNEDWVLSRSTLAIFDLETGAAPRLVAPEKNVFIETLAWAPSSNRLAFFAWDLADPAGVRAGVFHVYDVEADTLTPWPHRGLDLASERERGFAQKPERVMFVDGRLAVFARRHDGPESLLTYRDITREGAPDAPPKADWFLLDAEGNSENLTAPFKAVSAIPLHADADSIAVLADGGVWRVGPGRAPEKLTASIAPEIRLPDSMRYSTVHRPFRGEVLLETSGEEGAGFVLVDFATGESDGIAAPAGDTALIAGSAKAGALLFRRDHDAGADLVAAFADGRQEIVARLNVHMKEVSRTAWRAVSYDLQTAKGRQEVEGCLLLPPDYREGERRALIVEIYPNRGANCASPYGRIGGSPGPYSEHLLAARGYVVFKPNTARHLLDENAPGPLADTAALVDKAVDALVARGYADPERVGLLGLSQGGFTSLWLATQSQKFKAVVSLNGWTDMYSHYFDASYLQIFYADVYGFVGSAARYESTAGTDFPIGKTPYDDPDAYVRFSPLFHARDISAPVLLIHSDMDAFPMAHYERMFTALNLLGKKAELRRYWGEGHSPSSPANIRDMWERIFEWFAEHGVSAGAE